MISSRFLTAALLSRLCELTEGIGEVGESVLVEVRLSTGDDVAGGFCGGARLTGDVHNKSPDES